MNTLISDFKTRAEDRARIDTFCLLPSVFSELDLEDLTKSLMRVFMNRIAIDDL
jgi:hypothetical protein